MESGKPGGKPPVGGLPEVESATVGEMLGISSDPCQSAANYAKPVMVRKRENLQVRCRFHRASSPDDQKRRSSFAERGDQGFREAIGAGDGR